MTSLPITRPAPELPAGPRAALVVATGNYTDAALTRLESTARDAAEMAGVLANPDIGSFEVTSVVDRPAQEIRLALEDFLDDRGREDLIVVYLSCHGLLDRQDRLYFAATDTRNDRLAATGVEAAWLADRLEECRATCQVVILDCCNSGAFGRVGAKGEKDTDLHLRERFITQGRGRAVLTASRANQRSWEGAATGVVGGPSAFTSALVEGLRTGAADLDGDGYVSVEDAYKYAYRKVIESGVGQVPQLSVSTGEGTLLLARNPAGLTIIPAPLTEDLRAALDSPHPAVRLGAVNALGNWLTGPDPAKALSADQALRRIAANEVFAVASAARAYLNESGYAAVAETAASERAVAEPVLAGPVSAEPTVAEPAAAEPAAAGPVVPEPVVAEAEALVAEAHVAEAAVTGLAVTEAAAPAAPGAAEKAGRQPDDAPVPAARSGAVWLLATGFTMLLAALCIAAALLLQNSIALGPIWAIIAISALGLASTLGGLRADVVAGAILLWGLTWSVVYFLTFMPTYSSYSTARAIHSTECIVAAAGNIVLIIWMLTMLSKGRKVDPFLMIFTGFFTVGLVLAAIAFLASSLPVFHAVAWVTLATVAVGLPALIGVLRVAAPATEHRGAA